MSPGAAQAQANPATCARTVTADVVAINQPYFFNRLGTVNPAGQIFALRGDVVDLDGRPLTEGGAAVPGEVRLRADKRPRPLVLRANAGDCLVINFQNLLEPDRQRIQFDELPNLDIYDIGDDLPADRHAGIAVTGLSAVDHITNSGRAVGRNEDSTAAPGGMRTYKFYAAYDGAHLLYDGAVQWSGEGGGGSSGFGLFGAVNIQPKGAKYYRSKVSRADMELATTGYNEVTGHPIINYEAVYPEGHARAGMPILNMLDGLNLVHSDLEAIIVGSNDDGSFPATAYLTPDNPSLPNRLEPYREFTSVWQDEPKAVQAFHGFFSDPVLGYTLTSTQDSFLINYGSGGIGSEIIANRLGVGPMHDCLGCKYEDFFLSSFTVGDPAQIVDVPANAGLEMLAPGQAPPEGTVGPKATKVLYPDDPSNVHHSYIGDFTKFRNVHVGHEHHIFHLHAHQWLYNANDDESTMLDSQAIGPGSAFTYEIAFGGAGNRNRTPGDAIYHCHFYPHFAMGMWAHWRNHDVMEMGTLMDGDGRPATGSRAYPDGEIAAGTPIPAVIPLPGKPMPPMPGAVEVVPVFANGSPTPTSSVALVTNRDINPGFPFYVAGIEDAVGQRNTTPPLDILEDGGLRRHALLGFSAGGEAHVHTTRTDMTKEVERADVIYYDEGGTDLELVAMAFHAERAHDSFYPDGTPALAASGSGFRTNGAPATPGAPFADPCVDDDGYKLTEGRTPLFSGGRIRYDSDFNADNPRVYRAADIQMDMVFNKAGWHFPQQRLRVLNEDVAATLNNQRPPEPMVIRLNSFDCAVFEHTNLIPFEYELDDYQVKTPTDIVSAHIHLVKFDVMASDGAGNGWNYESGSLSPQEVVERILAIRAFNNCAGDHLGGDFLRDGGDACPVATSHPYFSGVPGVGNMALGARTTVQRWFADPVVNRSGVDRTLGTVFFHDHYGPSTHQQTGLYSTVLVQPRNSVWRQNETGELLGNRADGGPTSWQAAILPGDGSTPHREFFLQFADFQHAYEAGRGVDNLGNPVPDFAGVINPPLRKNATPTYPELVHIPAFCENGEARPCPEAITKSDPGTYVVNYRNEPLGLRLYDPNRIGTDGRAGWVADGEAGDPAFAMSSTVLRAIPELNTRLGNTPYPALTNDIADGDPFTPLMRTLAGDLVKLRVQTGSHEEEHNVTMHGLRWLQESASPNSGWRNSQIAGISEQFIFQSPVAPALGQAGPRADYAWVMNANIDGQWNGIWGVLRSYNQNRNDLYRLPNSSAPLNIRNRNQFSGVCPNNAPRRNYEVNAVRALDVLPPLMDADGNPVPGANPLDPLDEGRGTLVYNSRAVDISTLGDPLSIGGQRGPLHDPSALLYVLTEDLEVIPGNDCGVRDAACPVRLRADRTVEPLILRASAGECIDVRLVNRLPAELDDIPGVVTVPAIINRHIDEQGKTTFQSQMIRPSSHVGLHTQLVSYDVTRADGRNVGQNTVTTVPPGEAGTFRWYAGIISHEPAPGGRIDVVATPSEFGVVNIMPADPIKGPQKGLVGALVIQPQGSVWIEDPGTRASATVFRPDGTSFRDFVAIAQLGVNWLYADGTPVPGVNIEGAGVPADPKDSGHQAVNYRSEPLWYRYGFAPDVDFENQIDVTEDHRLAFSNALIGGADPQTPVFQAAAGTPVRLRLANPGGNSRNWSFEVTGHAWQHSPFVAGSNSNVMGMNPKSYFRGTQEGIGATAHWNLLMRAGGPFGVPGDYLYRDFSSFGQHKGGWGILRVNDADAPPPPPPPPPPGDDDPPPEPPPEPPPAEELVITAATATLRNNGRYNYSVSGTTNVVANNTITVFVRDNSDNYVQIGTATPDASGAWTLSVNNSRTIPQDPLQFRAISSGGETVVFP